jgi:hypothetical protein
VIPKGICIRLLLNACSPQKKNYTIKKGEGEARNSLSDIDIRQMRERVPHILSGSRAPRRSRPHPRPILLQARPISPRASLTLPLLASLNKIRLLCRLALQPSLRESKQAPCCACDAVARTWASRGGRETRKAAYGRRRRCGAPRRGSRG